MRLSTRSDLEELGFAGFLRLYELKNRTDVIPTEPGVYSVIWDGVGRPDFLAVGSGGWFKGIDPNVSVETLAQNWVAGSEVIYIGKASGGSSGRRGLRKRIVEYLEFGKGRPVGHKGGRYIWQMKDSENLVFCWKTVPLSPELVESNMLHTFASEHGRLPFANLRR